jgi:hypothetical protein
MESKSVRITGRQLPWTFLGRPRSMYINAFQHSKRKGANHEAAASDPVDASMRTMNALTPERIADWCHPRGNSDPWLDAVCFGHSDSTRGNR